MIKAILFDFDGLILDTETTEYQSWQEIYTDHGLNMDLHVWAECIGRPKGYFDAYAYFEQQYGKKVDINRIRVNRRKRNNELNAARDIMPGIFEYLIRGKEQGLKLAVASSSDRKWVEGHMGRLGVIDYFDLLVCKEDTTNHKPLPDPYLKALDELKIKPTEAIALEDSPNGIKSAKAAGVFCVAVPNEVTKELNLKEADIIIDSLDRYPLDNLIKGLIENQELRTLSL